MDKTKLAELKTAATKIRLLAVKGVHAAKSGHPGGSLSIADILAYLYFNKMNVDPKNPQWEDRDRLVLSKGHTAPALYSVLALKGYFSEDEIVKLRQVDSFLQGHPEMKHTPGVDMTTGSLGLGISAACGMALSAKISGKSYRTYAIVGDGESEEGQVWEACLFAAHYKLDNFVAVFDWNGLQIDGAIVDVMNPTPFDKKLEAFGFNVISIDGHNFDEIDAAFTAAEQCKGKPTAIIAKTTKGKGVSYMENQAGWHGNAPSDEQYEQAVAELSALL